jgi:3D (Asp-Asp-Asp) domain-containing protein
MKKRILGCFLILGILLTSTGTASATLVEHPTRAESFYKEPAIVRCTCYIDRGTMASGQQTRMGAIAGRKEWLGKVAALYRIEDGKIGTFLGYYEFLDTGAGMDSDGDGYGDTIRTGNSVDVWMPSIEDARGWIRDNGDYVWMQIIDGKG